MCNKELSGFQLEVDSHKDKYNKCKRELCDAKKVIGRKMLDLEWCSRDFSKKKDELEECEEDVDQATAQNQLLSMQLGKAKSDLRKVGQDLQSVEADLVQAEADHDEYVTMAEAALLETQQAAEQAAIDAATALAEKCYLRVKHTELTPPPPIPVRYITENVCHNDDADSYILYCSADGAAPIIEGYTGNTECAVVAPILWDGTPFDATVPGDLASSLDDNAFICEKVCDF